jgi:hypothetical protein
MLTDRAATSPTVPPAVRSSSTSSYTTVALSGDDVADAPWVCSAVDPRLSSDSHPIAERIVGLFTGVEIVSSRWQELGQGCLQLATMRPQGFFKADRINCLPACVRSRTDHGDRREHGGITGRFRQPTA